MADSSPSAAAISSNGTPTSTFRRTVTLYDWWLVKSQNDFHGCRLAISGRSSRKEEAVRFFVSAPIIKRYDVFSLETADGIYVITRGFINEQRTLESGFTPQILKSFLCGFPPNWESYALECIREGSEANFDLDNAIPDNVSAICQEILSDGEENFIPTSLVLPDEALEKCKKPFATEECKASKEMSGVDVAYGSGGNRRSTRLRNIEVCQQKQRPSSGGPREHPDKEQSSTSTEVETRDSDAAVSDNVTANLPQISSDAAEKSFPTMVSTNKTMGDCNKAFLEDEWDMPIKTGRWLLPPLEFWRNQQPIYNMDREITEIQEGSSLISPFSGSSPSLGRSAKNMRGGKRISAECVSNTNELKIFLQHKENDL